MEKRKVGIASNPERKIRIENPFALKVFQVFTGFGIGCGVGSIPVLQEVTNAARGATDVFSGVGRHVNSSLKSLGAKNVEVGIGCGVGFGHGFGVGLAIKPGVIHQLQSCFGQALAKVMMKFGALPGLPVGQNFLPESVKSSMSMANSSFVQNPKGHVVPSALTTAELTPQGQTRNGSFDMGSTYKNIASRESPLNTSFGSRTEKVINGFLQNPLLKDERDTELNES
ncbi:dynamin, partial [Thalictrum thalictroides]